MLKKLVFLGMGGTIAGSSDSASDNVGYKAGQVGVAQLLVAIPALSGALGDHEAVSEQVAQLDSKDLGHSHWKELALRTHHHLAMPSVSSVIITHGTDTLEETAFFLSRVLPAELLRSKPVVLTCAMRPASSSAPDGPQNVLDAVATALNSVARGVLVVCAGTVHTARDVQKVHPYRVNAFDSGDSGPLGFVEEGAVRWVHSCSDAIAEVLVFPFEKLTLDPWPWVEIIVSHAGVTGATVRALCGMSTGSMPLLAGIVVAGTGNGTIHQDLEAALRDAKKKGVRVLRSSRCSQGRIVAGSSVCEFAHSNGLSPVKARIALMLELMH
jgi:L-asparaginase